MHKHVIFSLLILTSFVHLSAGEKRSFEEQSYAFKRIKHNQTLSFQKEADPTQLDESSKPQQLNLTFFFALPDDVRALIFYNVFAEQIHAWKPGTCAGTARITLLQKARELIEGNADVNYVYNDKSSQVSPIHLAVMHENIIMTRLLINAGADVNRLMRIWQHENEKWGYCAPLHFIQAKSEQWKILTKCLIQADADINIADEKGNTALHIIATSSIESHGYDNCASLIDMLIHAGARINQKNEHDETPLHLAAHNTSYNSPMIVKLLINAGADINSLDSRSLKPIDHAKKSQLIYPEKLKLLMPCEYKDCL